ncbi:MAG: rRNA maturation RNase YbeY [Verrucomicrobiota bacterium]
MSERLIEVAIEVETDEISESKILELFKTLEKCPFYAIPPGDLSIAIVDESTICELHQKFLEDPTPTDVITFPGDAEADFAGEIAVCIDQAIKEHGHHGNTFEEEIFLYLIHGWLHLAGEDDREESARKRMRAAEAKVLGWLDDASGKID